MKKTTLPFILITAFFTNSILCCSCDKGTYRFFDNIDKYGFVALVEVIGKDTIEYEPLNGKKFFYSFAIVKILNQYSGQFVGKEIKIIDAKGFECFTILHFKNYGDKFIVKGSIEKRSEYVFNIRDLYDVNKKDENILVLSLCDMNRLAVVDNDVIGNITTSKSHRRWLWTSFIQKITFGLIDRRYRSKEYNPQKMKLSNFNTLIQKKLEG